MQSCSESKQKELRSFHSTTEGSASWCRHPQLHNMHQLRLLHMLRIQLWDHHLPYNQEKNSKENSIIWSICRKEKKITVINIFCTVIGILWYIQAVVSSIGYKTELNPYKFLVCIHFGLYESHFESRFTMKNSDSFQLITI